MSVPFIQASLTPKMSKPVQSSTLSMLSVASHQQRTRESLLCCPLWDVKVMSLCSRGFSESIRQTLLRQLRQVFLWTSGRKEKAAIYSPKYIRGRKQLLDKHCSQTTIWPVFSTISTLEVILLHFSGLLKKSVCDENCYQQSKCFLKGFFH